jgi:chemotaxis protein methyltransferase CheR
MRSPIWDQSSLFLLPDPRADTERRRDYTLQAGTGRSPAKFGQNLWGSVISRHRGSGPPLAVAVGRTLSNEQSTFFADLQGLASLVCVVLPALMPSRAQAQAIKLWVVGCETGQDAYSVAITLAELCPRLAYWDVVIVASDPDPGVLARAKRGIYSRSEVARGLPTEWLIRHFEPVPDRAGWRFSSSLAQRKRMKWLNLDPSRSCAAVGAADVVICRESFDRSDLDCNARRLLFQRLSDQLAPDGFLILPAPAAELAREAGFESLCAGGAGIYRRSKSRTSLLSA